MKTTITTIIGICLIAALCSTGAWAADAAAGKAVYDAKCKACHGADGSGNPNMAKALKVEMKPLSATTADVKQVVTTGQGKMKPVASVTGADLDNVVAYVKSLKK
ncbi:MAG TPA: cytochrome c [Bryobacteraceae bacterium]|nr:cytochrome c [Bryobacteraceae bacterium]